MNQFKTDEWAWKLNTCQLKKGGIIIFNFKNIVNSFIGGFFEDECDSKYQSAFDAGRVFERNRTLDNSSQLLTEFLLTVLNEDSKNVTISKRNLAMFFDESHGAIVYGEKTVLQHSVNRVAHGFLVKKSLFSYTLIDNTQK